LRRDCNPASAWRCKNRRLPTNVIEMDWKNIPFGPLVLFALATVNLASCAASGASQSSTQDIPVAVVKQGELQPKVYTTGELRATQSAMLIAPPIAGGALQIIQLVKTGTPVKKGDVVVAFDPSQQQYNLEQARSDFAQAEQEIVKAKDDSAVQTAQDQTALLKATFAVRQAELDVSKHEIVSAIDAEKNQLTLDEAKRALAQLQQDIQSHAASNQATIAVDNEKRNKASLAMKQAEENIANMQVRSPLNGLAVVQENEDASGGIFFGGMSLPEYQAGDQVSPGRMVAEVIDIDQMEIAAKVSEADRANLKIGQSVEVQVDARPGLTVQGKIKTLAGMSGGFFFDDNSAHKFGVTVQLAQANDELRPGFTTRLVILGDPLKHALYVPRQAVFQKDGKATVYVKTGGGFEPREIKIRYVTEGLAVIDGLNEGVQVALIDPTQKSEKTGASGPAPSPGAP
ncbi:MAG TPA: HlyD family efflux transporter periplasmic adaptor subunit, partial [Candidatus Acidoferrales bacterium]|nr:HlyD family efflux transporter periplasmic adaptor subunit [Candidatus Acidoferrales bacterium]